MKNVVQLPDRVRVEEEAAQWVARLDRGKLDGRERKALRDWLAQDPTHGPALQRMAQLWGGLDCLAILAELFPGEARSPRDAWRHWLPAGTLGAATVLLLVVGLHLAGLLDRAVPTPLAPYGATQPTELVYSTERGEQREVPLEDGSVLALNTLSEVRVRFDDSGRTLYLTHGEAHFTVARDPQRPFVVHAGHGLVRAVGTAFNIRLEGSHAEVLVNEGVVEVIAGPAPAAPGGERGETGNPRGLVLEKGGSAQYSATDTRAEALPLEQVEQRLAWRQGKWIFEGETLAEVLREIGRYTDHRIVIVDPQLASLRVGGYFDIGDIEGLMKALESGFGIRWIRDGNGIQLHSSLATATEG